MLCSVQPEPPDPISEFQSTISEFETPISEFESTILKFESLISEFESTIAEFETLISEFENYKSRGLFLSVTLSNSLLLNNNVVFSRA